MLHVSCRRFCNKINEKERCATLDRLTRKRLHHLHRLGRDEIHWADDRLGLRKEEGVHSHARLFSKDIATIQPPHAGEATELTAPPRYPKLRNHGGTDCHNSGTDVVNLLSSDKQSNVVQR